MTVHPSRQRAGYGRELLAAVEKAARGTGGTEALRLTCRGPGLERFSTSCGYQEAGRVPGVIKLAKGDVRDDTTMWLPLN